jgi:3-hydroxyacyl-[acyl-carrier-protein] dehydratase
MSDSEESLVAPALLMKMGPWRYPFFLVDKICEFKRGNRGFITAVKNISFNEPQFTGHFPDSPIMPGVLIAEAMGQTSDYLTLLTAFCLEYETRFACDLSARRDLQKALHSEEGMAIIAAIRKQWGGVLASQDLKFKSVVVPGDTLFMRSELIMKDPAGFSHFKVEARVGRRVATIGKIANFWFDMSKPPIYPG